jgi:hypothetical protein
MSTSTAVALPAANPWASYADAVAPETIKGSLLKFTKGDWFAGSDIVERGTEFTAFVDEIHVGWVRWGDGAPTEHVMGRIVDRFVPPRRDTLGDLDQTTWEVGPDDKPRDPWQFTNYLPLQDAEGEWFTFVTGSRGGLQAIARMLRTYGRQLDLHANDNPIVAIDTGSYEHREKSIGRIKHPIFDINGWNAKPGQPAVGEIEAAPAAAGVVTPGTIELVARGHKPVAVSRGDMNDVIPF